MFLYALVVFVATTHAVPPNIVILLTDDQGWGDNAYYCSNGTGMCPQTPNLDKLANSPHTAFFHRFYAAAGVCSPTRAAILTGRTNMRDCIVSALACDSENPAPTCAQGKDGCLPLTEFTVGKAAKKSKLGDYATIQLGKWHLGDLWDKKLPDMNKLWPVSSPGNHGFDEWMTTQAEASNSMSNCGCFPVHHDNPGPEPPHAYHVSPNGDQCVVGGGHPSDWCYPCTNYYYPNASDPRKVTDLQYKVPGDDSKFLMGQFQEFLNRQVQAKRPFLAHLCTHSIHEPHPAMPEYYHMYKHDPDYLGALTMFDDNVGRLMDMLETSGVLNNTIIFYTTDNGPHQGEERTDIRYSTQFLRQCKASIFEGGIRVPGMIHWPAGIKTRKNITMPASTVDFLPTIMDILQVETDNPGWVMDGMSLVPYLTRNEPEINEARPNPLHFWWGEQQGVIDNDWKLIYQPEVGQCELQPPYKPTDFKDYFLFNLADDYHELHDLKAVNTTVYQRMRGLLADFIASVENSIANETKCHPKLTKCNFVNNTGLNGKDIDTVSVSTKEDCCGACLSSMHCKAADFNAGTCHLKSESSPKARDGSIACIPGAV